MQDTANNVLPLEIILDGTEQQPFIIDLSDFDLYGLNHYRITAVYTGRNIGGIYDPETGLFTLNHTTENFNIAYVKDLRRILIRLDSYEILDLAGNSPTIIMDVLPVIRYGRTLLPVRFMAYVFAADVGWNGDTREVSLSLNDESLTFAIGQMLMDVPAQIINDRTFVPLRFISDFFGAQVYWDERNGSIELVR